MSKTNMHELTIREVRRETADAVSLLVDVPEDLRQDFKYEAGQYLTLETLINGEAVRRSYSLCSAPSDNTWRVAIKEVPGGKFSTHANRHLSAGDTLQVMAPTGNFRLADGDSQHFVGFAAGSGITPVLSMIRETMQLHEDSTFTLFYGNKGVDSIIFRDELEDLKNNYMGRLAVHHILSREKIGTPLFYGRIDGDKCSAFNGRLFNADKTDAYYLCGPAQMIFDVKDALEHLGVPTTKIKFELFSTDGLPAKAMPTSKEQVSINPKTQSVVTIVLDGNSSTMPLAYGGDNILDAALAGGADLPFACKGGVCSTCKAKVTKGEVEMDINYALEPDEVAAGFVLTCQAHPRTEEVTVDFDDTSYA
jgi:ring-1,2-phenylacetyl-CoA epoxidase subunit PaaE